jgi:hypothetical protein
MERDLEIDEELEPTKKVKGQSDIRADFIKEKQESAVGFKGPIFAKDLVEHSDVLLITPIGT